MKPVRQMPATTSVFLERSLKAINYLDNSTKGIRFGFGLFALNPDPGFQAGVYYQDLDSIRYDLALIYISIVCKSIRFQHPDLRSLIRI